MLNPPAPLLDVRFVSRQIITNAAGYIVRYNFDLLNIRTLNAIQLTLWLINENGEVLYGKSFDLAPFRLKQMITDEKGRRVPTYRQPTRVLLDDVVRPVAAWGYRWHTQGSVEVDKMIIDAF